MEVFPYNFDRPDGSESRFSAASTLINTYWVRFPRGESTFGSGGAADATLDRGRKGCGSQADRACEHRESVGGFSAGLLRGKVESGAAVIDSGLAYTIVPPTVMSESKTY